jgi:hypothetical protein
MQRYDQIKHYSSMFLLGRNKQKLKSSNLTHLDIATKHVGLVQSGDHRIIQM